MPWGRIVSMDVLDSAEAADLGILDIAEAADLGILDNAEAAALGIQEFPLRSLSGLLDRIRLLFD